MGNCERHKAVENFGKTIAQRWDTIGKTNKLLVCCCSFDKIFVPSNIHEIITQLLNFSFRVNYEAKSPNQTTLAQKVVTSTPLSVAFSRTSRVLMVCNRYKRMSGVLWVTDLQAQGI